MANLIDRISQSTLFKYVAAIGILFTFFSIIYWALAFFNLIPGYYAEWHKTNSVTPIVSLLPGSQIRLGFNSYSTILAEDIPNVRWEVISGARHYSIQGREPTLTLPPEGGIYQVCAEVTVKGEKRKGCSSVYVVQDKAAPVTFTQQVSVRVPSEKKDSSFLNSIKSKGVEIYSGNGQWIDAQASAGNGDKLTINIPANSRVSLINNQVIFRVKGSENNLNDYDSEHVSDNLSKKNNN